MRSYQLERTLIIVPPFAGLNRPSLGAHVLQSCSRRHGYTVDVLYANIVLASLIGEEEYTKISDAAPLLFKGERFFSLEEQLFSADITDDPNEYRPSAFRSPFLPAISGNAPGHCVAEWISLVVDCVVDGDYRNVGLSTTFEQTKATALLSRALSQRMPSITIVVGGANCEGDMADGIVSLMPEVSHVFSGESETTFVEFLGGLHRDTRIVAGRPNNKLDDIPLPDYAEYFKQLNEYLPSYKHDEIRLPYESSRGCWWGQKHHCTFCGLNGEGMGFREKSPEKTLRELRRLSETFGVKRFFMTDNIMPFRYFDTVLPKLAEDGGVFDIFYEQKANLSLNKVMLLKKSGVNTIQPGIEALDTDLLDLMRKGTSATNNIALMRYAKSLGVSISWNLLAGFPGDKCEWYDRLSDLIPQIHHLQPPSGVCELSLDRFSPYFDNPTKFGIKNLRPHPGYAEVFGTGIDLRKLAYHFVGEIPSGLIRGSPVWERLSERVEDWKQRWFSPAGSPILAVIEIEGEFFLFDTRLCSPNQFCTRLSSSEAKIALLGAGKDSDSAESSLSRQTVALLDGRYVALAVADPELMGRLASECT